MSDAGDTVWFEFIESKIFAKQVQEVGGKILARIQSELIQNPERGRDRERNAWRSQGKDCRTGVVAWKERELSISLSLP